MQLALLCARVFVASDQRVGNVNVREFHATHSSTHFWSLTSLSHQSIFMLNPPTLKFNLEFNGSGI
jgi:hypothetical protein